MTVSTTQLIPKKRVGPTLTSAQKKFSNLKSKIKKLQDQQKDLQNELDSCLQFYHDKIRPLNDIWLRAIKEKINISYQFYKSTKALPKSELNELKELVLDDLSSIFDVMDANDFPVELKEIFTELSGTDYEDMISADMEFAKSCMKQMFNQFGVDVDLSELDANKSQDENMRNIFRSLENAVNDQKNIDKKPQKKTKKQQEFELKKQAFEESQKKSMSNIYKDLARVLHPDLEQDSNQRIWKEGLMKRLTTAYKNKDLYELLSLETEWLNYSEGKIENQGVDQLEVYNAILNDQVEALQASLDMIPMHPKYAPMQQCFTYGFMGLEYLKNKQKNFECEIQNLQNIVSRLKTNDKEVVKFFKSEIKERRSMPF